MASGNVYLADSKFWVKEKSGLHHNRYDGSSSVFKVTFLPWEPRAATYILWIIRSNIYRFKSIFDSRISWKHVDE